MTDLDQLFADIARRHLGIPSMKPRMSDALDFHEVAVWGVRAALQAAFDAGTNARPPEANSDREPAPTGGHHAADDDQKEG
ncbi:DUF6900 domain-containing protein [Zavarzinella formosa]|uniref:DUF6900 domain-containing protein n=1 Tax=Zavarzinella formosa TaxID=360055 RepID=UPI0002D87EB8|nr:hypothetical protein [Zavarzinella formosa]